jgi:hypothetical protein
MALSKVLINLVKTSLIYSFKIAPQVRLFSACSYRVCVVTIEKDLNESLVSGSQRGFRVNSLYSKVERIQIKFLRHLPAIRSHLPLASRLLRLAQNKVLINISGRHLLTII